MIDPGRAGLAALTLLLLAAPPAWAEGRFSAWRRDHFGSRYNYRREWVHHLPRTGPAFRTRPLVAAP